MERFDVLVCTALLEELEAMLRVFDEPPETWDEVRLPNGFRYHHCTMRRRSGESLRVAAAWVGSDGSVQASVRLQAFIEHTKPRVLAISGICAGSRGAVALGDVIVADRVYRYDPDVPDEGRPRESYALPANWAMDARYFGRGFDAEGSQMRRRPITLATQRRWLMHALYAHEHDSGPAPVAHPDRRRACPDWVEVIPQLEASGQIGMSTVALALTEKGRAAVIEERLHYPDGPPSDPPVRVHFGSLATVSPFKRDTGIFDRLRAIDRKTLGLDLEAAAFCEVAHRLEIPGLVVKAVSDFADHDREPRFRSFAAAVSARFTMEFLLQAPLSETALTAPTITPADMLASPWSRLLPSQQKVLAALAACARSTTVSPVSWLSEMDEPAVDGALVALVNLGLATLSPDVERPWSTPAAVRAFVRAQPQGKRALERHAEYVGKALTMHADPTRWRELEQDVPEVLAAVDDATADEDHWGAYRLFARIFDHETRRGRYPAAMQRLSEFSSNLPDTSEESAEALINLAKCNRVLGHVKYAMIKAREAVAIANANDFFIAGSKARAEIGRCHLILGDLLTALRYSEEALALAETNGGRAPLKADLIGSIGIIHLARLNIDAAQRHLEQALKMTSAARDLAEHGRLLGGLGACLLQRNDVSGAQQYYQAALEIEERIGHMSGQAAMLSSLGVCSATLRDLVQAVDLCRRAVVIDEQLGDVVSLSRDLMRFGECHLALGNMRLALDSWQRSLDCAHAASLPEEHPDVVTLLSLLSGTGTYVTGVIIENVRSIGDLVWAIPRDAGPGWHVLIGDNGAGKSSFLRSVALTLVSETEAHALRQDWNDWLRRGKPDGSVQVELARHMKHPQAPAVTFEVALKLSRYADQVKLEDVSSPNDLNRRLRDGTSPGLFSAAYGPFRRFSGGDSDYEKLFASLPRLARHLSLFDERPALTESIAWLKLLDHKALERNPEGHILGPLQAFINQPDFLPHGTRLTKISSTAVTFTDGNGCEISIEQLSDGHRSILSLTLELLRQLTVTYGPGKIFDPDDPTRVIAPGIVLIDEVDVHLHPTWQRQIGIWFTKHFPRIQFIVTSHSPLVCQAAEVGTVFLLPKPGTTGGRMLAGAELDRLRYGNVLDAYGTGVFGQAVTRSESGKQMLDRLAELNDAELDRDLTAEELTEQGRLRATFPTTAHARAGGER